MHTTTTNNTTNTTNNTRRTRFGHPGVRLLALGTAGVGLALAAGGTASAAPVDGPDELVDVVHEPTCPKDGKIDVAGEHHTLDLVAPAGKLIAGYCVKAGSIQQGDGPEVVWLDEPVSEITISHSSGKAISHYTVFLVDEPGDEPGDEPQDEPGDEPGDEPQDEPGDEPGDEPQDDPEPQDDDPEPQDESEPPVPSDPPTPTPLDTPEVPVDELPSTGTATNVLAALAALLTAAGLGALRIARRTGPVAR